MLNGGTLLHLFRCGLYGLYKYKEQIERDEEIVGKLPDRNKSNLRTKNPNP